jgi:hypothetical protein
VLIEEKDVRRWSMITDGDNKLIESDLNFTGIV